MTPLGKIIAAEIAANGPMPIDRYMMLCLSHPEHGYYTTRNPIGASGDFTTAPEISQLFGEMIGIWLLQTWRDIGAPENFNLVEIGPGRGTLMADILRVTRLDSGFAAAMNICLVETSPSLCAAQSTALKQHEFTHHKSIATLPDAPLLLVTNELFDALPIKQFLKSDLGWHERLVNYADSGFEFCLGKAENSEKLDAEFQHLETGRIVEVAPQSNKIASQIGEIINQNTGAALIIDYGEMSGIGDTFQALKDHISSHVLSDQGLADLTSHVQFQPLIDASNCATQFTTQGHFLEAMGITARAQNLAQKMDDAAIDALVAGHKRLVHPDEMGSLFKVLALRPKQTPPLFGFET